MTSQNVCCDALVFAYMLFVFDPNTMSIIWYLYLNMNVLKFNIEMCGQELSVRVTRVVHKDLGFV